LLLARIEDEKKALQQSVDGSEQKLIKRSINRSYSEIARRLSLGMAAFTFTLMGASFGMSISRNKSNRGVFIVIGLSALYLCTFFVAKGIESNLLSAVLVYTIPQILLIGISLWVLSRISRGIET
jgi:lipopolysaccharide export system permease protein